MTILGDKPVVKKSDEAAIRCTVNPDHRVTSSVKRNDKGRTVAVTYYCEACGTSYTVKPRCRVCGTESDHEPWCEGARIK